MSRVLMVSLSAEGRNNWFMEWLSINDQAVSQHEQAHMVTTLRNGDEYRWVVLSPAVLSLEVDTIHFDDRRAGRMSPEQEELFAQLRYRVRIKTPPAN